MKNFILETPTGEGPEFTKDLEPSSISTDSKYKDFYLKDKFPGDSDRLNKAAEIIVNVKKFLLSHPNKIYPLDYKSFRDEVARIVKETFPAVGTAAAGWCARKIQDYLVDAKILVDERGGFHVNAPIKTIEVAKKVEKVLAPVLDKIEHTDKEHDLESLNDDDEDLEPEDLEPEDLEPEDEGWIQPPFNANIKYEKYGDKFKEEDLTEEEHDALDIFSDDDTGSTIIEKIHSARHFRSKSIKEIHALVDSLIKKNAIQPVGGYQFDVETDELPAYSQHKREERELTPEKSMYKKDENLIYEAYKETKNTKIVSKTFGLGLGNRAKVVNENFFTRLGNRAVSKLGTFAPNTAAAAKGRLQAEKSAQSLYKAFLQQASLAGYTKWGSTSIPGNFLVNWLSQNVDENINTFPQAQKIDNERLVINPQQIFNELIQTSYGGSVTNKTVAQNPYIQKGGNYQVAQPKAAITNPPAPTQGPTLSKYELDVLLNKLANCNNKIARESAIRASLKKVGVDVQMTP